MEDRRKPSHRADGQRFKQGKCALRSAIVMGVYFSFGESSRYEMICSYCHGRPGKQQTNVEKREIASPGELRHIQTMRQVHAVFQNDGKWFIGGCLGFPVTTQGKTLAAAKKNLQEAVELYLETWGECQHDKAAT